VGIKNSSDCLRSYFFCLLHYIKISSIIRLIPAGYFQKKFRVGLFFVIMLGAVVCDTEEKINKHLHGTSIQGEVRGHEMQPFTVRKYGVLVNAGVFCPKCFLIEKLNIEK
jgi:hypothetical protein